MPATDSIRYVAVLALIPITGCLGGPHMISERDEAVPVPHHATWAWAEPDTTGGWERDPALASEITEQRFRRAFDSVLSDLHFEQIVNVDSADFTLTYHIGVRRAPHQGAPPAGHGVGVAVGFVVGGTPGYGWGPGFGPPGYMAGGRGYAYGAPGFGWGAGMYAPGWGWGAYGPPVYAGSVLTTYQAQYGMGALVAVLRSTNNGDVAWEGTYLLDPYEMQGVTQHEVHDIVVRLMEKLR